MASPLDAVGSPRTPCHGAHFVYAILCVRAVARRSHGDLNERRENAVGSQRQRSNSAMRSPRAPRGRRVYAARTHMIAARTPLWAEALARRPHGVYRDVTATLPRPHDVSTAFVLCLRRVSFIPLRPHGDHTELPRLSLCFYGAPTEPFGVCRGFAGR